MDNNDPRFWILERVFTHNDGTRGPLFDTIKELSKDIKDQSKEYDNVDSLQVLLSQSLKAYNERQSKPLPLKLKKEIINVCVKKIDKNPDEVRLFIKEFNEALHFWKSPDAIPKSTNLFIWRSFKRWAEIADDHYVFTHEPAELKWEEHKEAREIVDRLCEKVILSTEKITPNYHFHFPSKDIANSFWRKIRKFLIEVKDMPAFEADKLLEDCDKQNKIEVFQVSSGFCTPHMSFMCHNQEPENTYSLFMFSYFENNDISVTQASNQDMNFWYTHQFTVLQTKPDVKKIRIRYAYAKATITIGIKGISIAGY